MDVGGVRWWCAAAYLSLAGNVWASDGPGEMPASGTRTPVSSPAVATQQFGPPSAPDQSLADARKPAWQWAMPEDSAARHSPFLNSTTGGISVGNRFDSSFYLGAEFGGFFGRFRGSVRALFPFGIEQPTGAIMTNPEFRSIHSQKPALIWGAGFGVALYSGYGFVASLSANFMRADEGDFGNWLGVALPLEWITRGGIRVGTELGVLGAFGGEVLASCRSEPTFAGFPTENELDCDVGEVRAFNRDPGTGVWLHFMLGVPFEHPEPVLVPPTAE